METQRPRAIVYFDGFNFYYGCFNNSRRAAEWRQCKWLDLHRYCRLMFPQYEIQSIRYFTANIAVDALDPDKSVRQQMYLRALGTLPTVTLHHGHFTTQKKWRVVADPRGKGPVPIIPEKKELVLIPEEKGSDVNLASHLLMDAFRKNHDVSIVVSNDADLAEPIRLVINELGMVIEILNPHVEPSWHLQQIQGISHRRVTLNALQAAQFPGTLTDQTGIFSKPSNW